MSSRYRLEVAATCRLIVDTRHDGPDPLGAYTVIYRDSTEAAQREVDRLNATEGFPPWPTNPIRPSGPSPTA